MEVAQMSRQYLLGPTRSGQKTMKFRSFSLSVSSFAVCAFAHAKKGVYPDPIVIGQSAALSGPASGPGTGMREAAMAYFDEVNRNGGVHGRRIEFKSLNDAYEPERAAVNKRKLIDDERVFALFGYVGTPTSQASIPVFTAAKVPFFGAFARANYSVPRDPFNKYIVRASYYGLERINQLDAGGFVV